MINAIKEHGSLAWVADNAPANCGKVADLYSWSSNFADFAPFTKYLDLTGYSAEEVGQNLAKWGDDASHDLGYMELGKLGEALAEYSDHPREVEEFVRELLSVESEFGL